MTSELWCPRSSLPTGRVSLLILRITSGWACRVAEVHLSLLLTHSSGLSASQRELLPLSLRLTGERVPLIKHGCSLGGSCHAAGPEAQGLYVLRSCFQMPVGPAAAPLMMSCWNLGLTASSSHAKLLDCMVTKSFSVQFSSESCGKTGAVSQKEVVVSVAC